MRCDEEQPARAGRRGRCGSRGGRRCRGGRSGRRRRTGTAKMITSGSGQDEAADDAARARPAAAAWSLAAAGGRVSSDAGGARRASTSTTHAPITQDHAQRAPGDGEAGERRDRGAGEDGRARPGRGQCEERVGADGHERREHDRRDRQPRVERVRRAAAVGGRARPPPRTATVIERHVDARAPGRRAAISPRTPMPRATRRRRRATSGRRTIHGQTSGWAGVGLHVRRSAWTPDRGVAEPTVVDGTAGRRRPRDAARDHLGREAPRRSRDACQPITRSCRSCLLVIVAPGHRRLRRRGSAGAVDRSANAVAVGRGATRRRRSAAPSAAQRRPERGEPVPPDEVGNLGRRREDRPHRDDRAGGRRRRRRRCRGPRRDPGMGGYIGASETAERRRPPDRDDHISHAGRPLGGRARPAAWHRRPATKVVNERTQAVEVTGAVVDLEARIRNLRASEVALQDIAAKAVRVSDVLEVQAQLTAVRGQIEQLDGPADPARGPGVVRHADRARSARRSSPCRSPPRAGSRPRSSTRRRPAWSTSCRR